MSIYVKIAPSSLKYMQHLYSVSAKSQLSLQKGLMQVGIENARHAKALIRDKKSKTGRWYVFRGRPHQASAPGEAPANRSGELQRSIGYQVRGWHSVEFGTTLPYGKWLENGTKDGKIAPRPFLSRTVKEKSKDNFITIESAIDKTLRMK